MGGGQGRWEARGREMKEETRRGAREDGGMGREKGRRKTAGRQWAVPVCAARAAPACPLPQEAMAPGLPRAALTRARPPPASVTQPAPD